MQTVFIRRLGGVWLLKPSRRPHYVGLFATVGGFVVALLVGGISKGSPLGWVLVSACVAVGLYGVFMFGSGASVRVDFGRRVFVIGEITVPFDQASGLVVDMVSVTEEAGSSAWWQIHLLAGPEGGALLASARRDGLLIGDRAVPGVHRLAVSWRDDLLRSTAQELSERAGIPLVSPAR